MRGRGVKIAVVPWQQFQRTVSLNSAETDTGRSAEISAVWMSFARWVTESRVPQTQFPLDLFQATDAEFDVRVTRIFLRRFGIVCPCPDRTLLAATVDGILDPECSRSLRSASAENGTLVPGGPGDKERTP